MSKIPVFDIGDTLMPSFRLQNRLIQDELRVHGQEAPEFDVNNFRIYTPSEVKSYMEENGIEHPNPERLIEKYKERERKFMEENGVFSFLKNCSEEFGKIGFISDNTIEGKKWFETQLNAHNVPFQGLVVSEEVGVEKPDPQIFREFFDYRENPAEDFVYFGNNLNRDPACREVGMKFVFVDQYRVYGKNTENFTRVEKLTVEKVREAMNK